MKNRLMRLLRDNANAKARMPLAVMKTEAAPDVAPEATLYLYDVIVDDPFWGGVGAEDFVMALAEASISADTIHLRINCPGGDVFAARAMEAAVRGCSKKVVAHVDGYAASAASYLALACDEVEIAPGAFFMIHKAWTLAMGNCDDLAATSALLAKIDTTLVKSYVAETGQTPKAIKDMMAAETWMTAEEAVALGFADRIMEDAPKDKASAKATWNLAAYQNAPVTTPSPEEEDEPEDPAETPLIDPEEVPAPDPDDPANCGGDPEDCGDPKDGKKPKDVLHGEPDPCTSDANVGLNPTQEYGDEYFQNLNRQLRMRGVSGDKRKSARQ